MRPSPAEISRVAEIGCWIAELYARTQPLTDSSITSGDGVDDIDLLLAWLVRNPAGVVRIDVQRTGIVGGSGDSAWRTFGTAELTVLRESYVSYHGEANKVNEYPEVP